MQLSLNLDSKSNYRSFNPSLVKNEILRACGSLILALSDLQFARRQVMLNAEDHINRLYLKQAHNISAHQVTEAVKGFVKQKHCAIGLRKILKILQSMR